MKNQVLITIDSLRYDVFEKANAPFLKSHIWERAFTQATYTLPAHMSFFVGKLPCNFTGGKFDSLARIGRKLPHKQQWRLLNPESKQPCHFALNGKNIIDGFNKLGYTTIGTGGVSWFNTNKPAHIPVIKDFKHYKWCGEYCYGKEQIKFLIDHALGSEKYFGFINFGETHHPFKISPNDPGTTYGNPDACINAQVRALEHVNNLIEELVSKLNNVEIFICGDHGECLGDDGLWGHSFYHPKVIEVPIVYVNKD